MLERISSIEYAFFLFFFLSCLTGQNQSKRKKPQEAGKDIYHRWKKKLNQSSLIYSCREYRPQILLIKSICKNHTVVKHFINDVCNIRANAAASIQGTFIVPRFGAVVCQLR